METQNNHTLVPILGLMLDSISVSRAVEISKTYLENDYFNFVLLAGVETAIGSQEQSESSSWIRCADLILPGDRNVEEAAQMKVEGGYQEKYLDEILILLAERKNKLCILCDTAEQGAFIAKYLEEDYPGLKVVEIVFEETGEEELEALVNKINGNFPDVILPFVPMEKQEKLILAHKETINAKLCIGSETIHQTLYEIMQSGKESVKLVKWLINKLHIGKKAVEDEFWQRIEAEKEKEKLDI